MDPISQNIKGVQQLVGAKINKVDGGVLTQQEGPEGIQKDELDLEMDDAELIRLKTQVETEYGLYEPKISLKQKANLTYYLGKQKAGSPQATGDFPVGDNLIFEATETFVPAALSRNPDPVVFSDDTPEGDALATDVKVMLQYHADILSMRSQLNLMVRKWLVDLLAVVKHGWDSEIKDIIDDVRDVKNFIFDKNGYVDIYGNFVGLLGERIKSTAQELVDEFPKHKEYIVVMVDGKMGTEVIRTEWWTDKFTFTTFREKVLDKSKNPNFNYDSEKEEADVDGVVVKEKIRGNNHFGRPKKPYTFLSQFSFGEQPHDVTGLIEQNITNQKRVTERSEQIDFNLSRQNNSDVFSEDNFNQETATQAKNALAKGNPMLVPQGKPISEAIVRLQAQGLDSSFFNDLQNQKTALRMAFGTEGITASPPDRNELATGLVINKENDSSRVRGGIGDALERVAKSVFNQHVQFYYVYYTEEHTASIMGQMRAVEYTALSSDKLNKKLVVSVSPNSMKPHDEITEMNQAMELYKLQAIDPKTLLTRINFPDPQTTAEQSVLWKVDPQTYMQLNFPEIAQKIQEKQQQMMAEQQQAQQQQVDQQGQIQVAQADQQLTQKEIEHAQKVRHKEEEHQAKLKAKQLTKKQNGKD